MRIELIVVIQQIGASHSVVMQDVLQTINGSGLQHTVLIFIRIHNYTVFLRETKIFSVSG